MHAYTHGHTRAHINTPDDYSCRSRPPPPPLPFLSPPPPHLFPPSLLLQRQLPVAVAAAASPRWPQTTEQDVVVLLHLVLLLALPPAAVEAVEEAATAAAAAVAADNEAAAVAAESAPPWHKAPLLLRDHRTSVCVFVRECVCERKCVSVRALCTNIKYIHEHTDTQSHATHVHAHTIFCPPPFAHCLLTNSIAPLYCSLPIWRFLSDSVTTRANLLQK